MSQSLRNLCRSLGAQARYVGWHFRRYVGLFFTIKNLFRSVTFQPSCLNVCTFILVTVTVTAFSMTRHQHLQILSQFSLGAPPMWIFNMHYPTIGSCRPKNVAPIICVYTHANNIDIIFNKDMICNIHTSIHIIDIVYIDYMYIYIYKSYHI